MNAVRSWKSKVAIMLPGGKNMLLLLSVALCSAWLHAADVFVARHPYRPAFRGNLSLVDLAERNRYFDFSGDVPFVNSDTGVSDIATINYWNVDLSRQAVLTSGQISNQGVHGRVFKAHGYTSIGYVSGDGVVEGTLRTQLNSFPIPERRNFRWDLVVRFGGETLEEPWHVTPRGVSPATVWQLKSHGQPPSLVMVVDADPSDSTKLMLHFDHRSDAVSKATRLGQIGGLLIGKDIDIVIDCFLDERDLPTGEGYFRVQVDGNPVVDYSGSTVLRDAQTPPAWSIGMYLYKDKKPISFSRFGHWKKARLLID